MWTACCGVKVRLANGAVKTEFSPSFDPQATVHRNNMADKLPAFDESLCEWETSKSKDGASYRVGRGKIDGESLVPLTADAGKKDVVPLMGIWGKEDFGISVDWTVEDRWKDTSADVVDTAAITAYKLSKCDEIIYKYCLKFTNTKHYNYRFFDETGDGYQVDTWANGDHYVQYNSDKPNIKYVSGN